MAIKKEFLRSSTIALMGVPFDDQSSFMRGPAQAPNEIRAVWADGSSNYFTEGLMEIDDGRLVDIGDMDIGQGQLELTDQMRSVLASGSLPLSLGGDHSITYWLIKAIAEHYPDLTIIQFDAHPDLYHEFEDNRYSHACPFARIMEEKLANRLIQIGIRAMNTHQSEQATKFGVEQYPMQALKTFPMLQIDGPVYISFDLDVLDPGFAPGISHYEPGGMSPREALHILHDLDIELIGADIVEYNPVRDHHGMTAMVACKLIKELSGMMLRSSS